MSLRLSELAAAQWSERNSVRCLLKELSITPITEDIVTGASASHSILTEEEEEIDMVIS